MSDAFQTFGAGNVVEAGDNVEVTGYINGKRVRRGQKVWIPGNVLATVYGVLRGEVGLHWNDPLCLSGIYRASVREKEVRIYKLPAAVHLAQARRGG